jgi:bifunctional non-homologous end joining protein LigD
VRTRRDPKEWLLIKHRDAHADPGRTRPPGEASVLSGLALDELREGPARSAAIEAELARLGAPRRPVDLDRVRPMLAEPGGEPFSDRAWIYELKWDGWRALAARDGREARVRYRSGASAAGAWPEIERALRALPFERFLIDGEIVVLDEEGQPSFARLSRRARLRRPGEAERAAAAEPATLVAFDLLAFGPYDLRPLPLAARKEVLRGMLPREGPLRWADHVEGEGEAFFRAVRERGLEGVVAKRADAPYREGRSPLWRKVRAERTGDFAVVGFTAPGSAARAALGALHLAAHDGRGLRYAGSVGTGFDDRELVELRARLEPRRRRDPPCAGPVPAGRGNVWVEPELCVEVRYLERTEEGLLRHPAFVRLREDKRPEECELEGEEPAAPTTDPTGPRPRPGPRPRAPRPLPRAGGEWVRVWGRRRPRPSNPSCRTSTRSSSRRTASPRATSSPGTGSRPPGCSPGSATVRWC